VNIARARASFETINLFGVARGGRRARLSRRRVASSLNTFA